VFAASPAAAQTNPKAKSAFISSSGSQFLTRPSTKQIRIRPPKSFENRTVLTVLTRSASCIVKVCKERAKEPRRKLVLMPDIELNFSPQLAAYIRSVSRNEPNVLERLREETASLPDARMQISPEQGKFFEFLIRATGAKRCLEVGVFTGYSSTAVALALPPDGHLTACDVMSGVDRRRSPLLARGGCREQDRAASRAGGSDPGSTHRRWRRWLV
jgi:hypothetical protein